MSQNRLIRLPYLQFFSKEEEWWHDGSTKRFGRFDILDKDMTEEFKDIITSWNKSIDFRVNQQGRSQRTVRNAKIISVIPTWCQEGCRYECTYTW